MKFCRFLLIFIISLPIFSKAFTHPDFHYFIDIPHQWQIIDAENPATIAFSNPEGNAIMQIFTYAGDAFPNSEELYLYMAENQKANHEYVVFQYQNKQAVLGDLIFQLGEYHVHGYLFALKTENYNFILLCYSTVEEYNTNHDFLLSFINTFASHKEEQKYPGPISQFYYDDKRQQNNPVQFPLAGKYIATEIDQHEIEASEVLIEREARILLTYKEVNDRIIAWERYYKIVYRDNYQRLKSFSDTLNQQLQLNLLPEEQKMNTLLSWLQNFKDQRKGGVSDLVPPLAALYTQSGDCDSRALVYMILLKHLNINSIFLVSMKYQHAAVGLDIAGDGAKLNLNGKDYLYTELMEEVDIGLVHQDFADPSGWIMMNLEYQ
ncbi:MAG: hypothetical protein MJB14_11920 [Spirochaetes bacterium]|nr:hypothetical protein [Spirochaetota bacterium]